MCYGKPDHIETGGAGLGIKPNEEIMINRERLEDSAANIIAATCRVTLSPKTWPKMVRRIYLLGSPIFVPIHLAAIALLAMLFAVGTISWMLIDKAVELWQRDEREEGW